MGGVVAAAHSALTLHVLVISNPLGVVLLRALEVGQHVFARRVRLRFGGAVRDGPEGAELGAVEVFKAHFLRLYL
jgi:hypothetical protein